MKIMFITFEFGENILGGVGRAVNGLTSELRKSLNVDIFHLSYSPKYLSVTAKLYRCSADNKEKLLASFPTQYVANCIKALKSEKYDLVHVFSNHWAIDKIISRVEIELPSQNILYSVHSLAKFEKGIRVNPASTLNCEEKLLQAAHSIHILNQSSYSNLKSAYGNKYDHKIAGIIPNGVNAEDFVQEDQLFKKSLRRKIKSNEFNVLCLSRWAQGKGIEYFLDAAKILLKNGYKVKFILAGRRNISWEFKWDNYLKKIDDKVKRLGGNIIVLDWLNDAQRNTLFKMCDAFVMPSELEYFPYSVLEPVVAGLPLIASDLPCVQELFRDQNNCLFFQSRNSEDLAEKMIQLIQDQMEIKKLTNRISEKIISDYSWKTVSSQYLEMYRHIIVAESNVELLKVV